MSQTMSRLTAFQRFKRLLQRDKKDISQVYIYAFFNGLVNLSLPLGIQAIINLIQGGEITSSWMILVFVVIGGIGLTGYLQLLQLRIVENIAQKIFSRASFEFAYRIPRIKHSAFEDYYAPELTNRFFDTMTIQKGLPKILIDFSLALFQIVVGLIVLSLYHTFFIIFSIILVALIYFIIAITGPRGLRTSIKESSSKYKIAFWLEEIARTKMSFKLISESDYDLSQSNEKVNQYLTDRENHFKILIGQFSYLIGFKVVIAAGLLITGSILVFNQEMNIGQFVAAEIIIILIIASVEKLIKSLDSIYDVLTALEKIGYVLDMPLDQDDGLEFKDEQVAFSVTADRLYYKFPNDSSNTIDGFDLHVPEGKSVIIDGPSGSGKSTFLQLLSGILHPDRGIIKYKGFPLQSLNMGKLRKHIGFSLSQHDIFQGTVLDNIKMGRDVSATQITTAIRITRLDDFISSIPLGLKTILDPEGRKLPRSVQDKIKLARAIVNEPKLLILEDPLNHISSDEKENIISEVVRNKPWSIIITTVSPIWSKYISDKVLIEKGRVIYSSFESDSHA